MVIVKTIKHVLIATMHVSNVELMKLSTLNVWKVGVKNMTKA